MHTCLPAEARGRHWSLWSWRYRQLWVAQNRCLELNPDPLEEQQVLLTPKSSPQLLKYLLIYLIASDCNCPVARAMPYLFLLTQFPARGVLLACLQMPLRILRNESSIVALSDFPNWLAGLVQCVERALRNPVRDLQWETVLAFLLIATG